MDRQGGNISVRTDLENHPQIESYCDFSRLRGGEAETCDPDCELSLMIGRMTAPGVGLALVLATLIAPRYQGIQTYNDENNSNLKCFACVDLIISTS